jgi:hypothetical protein
MSTALIMTALKTRSALGAEQTFALAAVNNLGLLYTNQGKIVEPEEMYLRALQGYESTLGAHHMRKECFGGYSFAHSPQRSASC